MIDAIAKGDEIATAGGLLGKVSKVSDSYVTIEISEHSNTPIEVVMQKASVATVLPKGTIKAL
jgi:preprotein translocase subunit YajC